LLWLLLKEDAAVAGFEEGLLVEDVDGLFVVGLEEGLEFPSLAVWEVLFLESGIVEDDDDKGSFFFFFFFVLSSMASPLPDGFFFFFFFFFFFSPSFVETFFLVLKGR